MVSHVGKETAQALRVGGEVRLEGALERGQGRGGGRGSGGGTGRRGRGWRWQGRCRWRHLMGEEGAALAPQRLRQARLKCSAMYWWLLPFGTESLRSPCGQSGNVKLCGRRELDADDSTTGRVFFGLTLNERTQSARLVLYSEKKYGDLLPWRCGLPYLITRSPRSRSARLLSPAGRLPLSCPRPPSPPSSPRRRRRQPLPVVPPQSDPHNLATRFEPV